MTEQKITEKLVEDIDRILTVTGRWNLMRAGAPKKWKWRVEHITACLNTAAHDVLLEALAAAQGDVEEHGVGAHILTPAYVSNTITLVRYHQHRMSKLMAAGADRAELPLAQSPSSGSLPATPALSESSAAYLKWYFELHPLPGAATALRYQALERADSNPEELARQLSALLGGDFEITVHNQPIPSVHRSKMSYLGHRIWLNTLLLPVLRVTRLTTPEPSPAGTVAGK